MSSLLEQFPGGLANKEVRRCSAGSQWCTMVQVKLGGSPLHWCTEKPLLDGLVGLGCAVEGRNTRGDTALHVMVGLQGSPG